MKYAAKDFSFQDWPRTRRAEFGFLLRNRRRTFVALCGLVLLGMVPLIVVCSFRMFNLAALEESWQAENTAKEIVALERARFLLAYHLFDIPCFACLFLIFSAVFRIERQMVLNQPVFFWADAWEGIKKDGLLFFCLGLLFGLIRFGCAYVSEIQSFPYLLRFLPYGGAIDFLLPALLFCLSLRASYRISWKELFKGSFVIFFHHAGISLLFAWGLALWELVVLIPFFLVRLLALILEGILFLPLWSLGWMLFSFYCFDRDINPVSCPADTFRGLAPVSKEMPRREK